VLKASNTGNPVIMDIESPAGQAYTDAVGRFLGDDRPHRFLEIEKKKPGLFGRLFGGRAA
jgi:septum site-determining protein MinD